MRTLLYLLLFALSTTLSAQSPKTTISAIFEAMKAGDTTGLRTYFHPDATLHSVITKPDGKTVVSIGTDGDRTTLYARRLDDFEWSPLLGSNAASDPFFSPDGQWVGFMQVSRVYKINLSGGAPVLISDGSSAAGGGPGPRTDTSTWSPVAISTACAIPGAPSSSCSTAGARAVRRSSGIPSWSRAGTPC